MKINKELFKHGVTSTVRFAHKHVPEGLIILGTGGVITTVVLACKETPGYVEVLEQAKEDNPDISKVDVAVITAKHYWKPISLCVLSLMCFYLAHSEDLKRQAAALSAYALSEKALREYKEGVIAELGDDKANKVEEAIAQKHIRDFDFPDNIPGQGSLFYIDNIRFPFRADIETMNRIRNDLNAELYSCSGAGMLDGEITLNQVYNRIASECGIRTLGSVTLGDMFGWRADLTGPIEYNKYYGHNEKDEPCCHIEFRPALLTRNINDLYY